MVGIHKNTLWGGLALLLGLPALALALSGGCKDPDAELCEGVECSGHGTCRVEGGQALCECDTGYLPGGSLTCRSSSGDGDADVDGDADGDGDADWTITIVPGEEIGRYSSIDVSPNGSVGVAYYTYVPYDDGLCEEVSGEQPQRMRWPVMLSERAAGATDWVTETVVDPIHLNGPAGLSFRYTPSGAPSMAVYGGVPIDTLCSANDVLYYSRAGAAWNEEIAVTGSGEAAAVDNEDTGCSAAASNAGYTVGEWPALGIDQSGNPAILYRDTHFGGIQHDDTFRADAELAYRQGGWGHEMVDCGVGGGVGNAVTFDSSNRFVGIQRITRDSALDTRHGLWAHRREEDGTYRNHLIARGTVGVGERSLTAGADDYVAAIYYDPTEQHAWVAELTDPTRFSDGSSWLQTNIGNNSYNEGQQPAIALAPDGTLAVAYYRCARTGVALCDPDHDALVFGWRRENLWHFETVDEGAAAACGTELSLAIGPDGAAHISYVCVRHVSGSDFVEELKVASRRPL